MIADLTAQIFRAFLYGAVGIIGGGGIFESGKRYTKGGNDDQFKGKVEVLPFFFATLILGWFLQHLDPVANEIVRVFPPLTRLGMMVLSSMLLLNYSVDYFNYTDRKSLAVYFVGLVLMYLPFH